MRSGVIIGAVGTLVGSWKSEGGRNGRREGGTPAANPAAKGGNTDGDGGRALADGGGGSALAGAGEGVEEEPDSLQDEEGIFVVVVSTSQGRKWDLLVGDLSFLSDEGA